VIKSFLAKIKAQIEQRSYLSLFLVLVLIFSFAFGATYLVYSKVIAKKNAQEVDNSPARTPSSYFGETKKDESVKNILLLGYGGAGHAGGTLSDSIILLSISSKTKKAVIISIPRDIWIGLPVDWENLTAKKINEAYAIGLDDTRYPNKKPEFRGAEGGGNMVKYAVSQVTGLSVDYFIGVSFDQYEKLIDNLGGINVNVPVGFSDEYYPIKGMENDLCGKSEDEVNALKSQYTDFNLEKNFKCRYETLTFEKGEMKMDGATALKFVRSRHSNQSGGDFARSERQMAVLIAIKDKLLSIDAAKNIDKVYTQLSKLVTTDLNLATAKTLLEFFGDPNAYQISKINLSTENTLTESKSPQGAFILLPKAGFGNWEETKEYIKSASLE
jgi:anionic cell wall polymer biosynthesis LytR-Cps2A-Psr (LCP) family protein